MVVLWVKYELPHEPLADLSEVELLGLSKEVGAFIAGASLAPTPYREAIGSRLVPQLIERGHEDLVRNYRLRFQEIMRDKLCGAVEEATGYRSPRAAYIAPRKKTSSPSPFAIVVSRVLRLPDLGAAPPLGVFLDLPQAEAEQRILDAALEVFGAGYELCSIDSITKRAGCSRPGRERAKLTW